MRPAKQKIVILMPMVDSVRNIVNSGVLENLLREGVDVTLLIPGYHPSLLQDSAQSKFALGANIQPLLVPPVKRRVKGLALLKEVIGSAFSQRNKIGSYVLYARWYSRHFTSSQRLRSQIVEILGFLAQPAPIFYGLYRLYNYLYRLEKDLSPARQQLREINPDIVLSTFNVDSTYERAYVLAAKELGIPLVNSIMSFDNLTSKPAHLLYDYYLVWNQGMQDQLLRFYPQVDTNRVYITGTPQFDFHRRPDCLWKREDTLARLGLLPGAKYFLYGASPKSLTPAEPELVALLADKMQKDELLKEYWLVVRTHPRDVLARWESVRQIPGHLLLSKTLDIFDESSGLVFPTLDDQACLTSPLAHSEACINIASTITIDAAILDRPVIGIRFDKQPDAPREIIYEEYDTDHYRPLVESGGLRLAHDWNEILDLMREAIQNPGRDRSARARMVAQECGVVDGNAARRVADALLDCLRKIDG